MLISDQIEMCCSEKVEKFPDWQDGFNWALGVEIVD